MFRFISKRKADMFARCGAASWFSAWHWQRLRRMPAWDPAPPVAEAAPELQPELELAAAELAEALELQQEPAAAERALAEAVGAAEQFIAQITKLS